MVVELTIAIPQASRAELFAQLFEAEHSYVLHSLRRLGVAERDLEDVTHDVFVVVHRKLPEYDASRPARPWLFAIAVRAASDYRRRGRTRLEQVSDALDAHGAPGNTEHELERREQRALVIEALRGVEESRLPLFVMVDLDEVPVVDAAAALSIPLNTAYSRLRLARADFAAAVARLRAARGGR